MLFLLLAIVCSTSVGVLVRVARSSRYQVLTVIAGNYVVAATIMWVSVLTNWGSVGVDGVTVALALGGGLLWPASIIAYSWVIGRVGLLITGATARLSLSVPVAFGVVVLGEAFTVPIAVGLALIVTAFVLLRPAADVANQGLGPALRAAGPLVLLIGMIGCVDLWVNLFNTYGEPNSEPTYFALLFSFAALVAWAIRWRQLQRSGDAALRPARRDLVLGAVLGVPNLGATWALLQAIQSDTFDDHTSIAYATFSSSVLLSTVLAGVLIWHERLLRRQAVGIAVAIAAIVILNLSR